MPGLYIGELVFSMMTNHFVCCCSSYVISWRSWTVSLAVCWPLPVMAHTDELPVYMGLSDEFVQHSCRAFGSVAALSRQEEIFVPLPEVRVHNLTFDKNAYGGTDWFDPNPPGFHLRIFGCLRHRYIYKIHVNTFPIDVKLDTYNYCRNNIILGKFSSLAAPEVVILINFFCAASEERFAKITTFPIQWFQKICICSSLAPGRFEWDFK